MKKIKIVQAGYDKVAKKYHSIRSIYPSKALLHKFSNLLQKDAHVLDLGCGAGVPVDQYLSNNNFQVTGIDFSKKMIQLAKKHVPKAHFKKMDICRMQFKENSFDGAVSFYAIIHIPREKHVGIYRKLHRIIKPNGIVLLNGCGSMEWEGYEKDYLGSPMFWSHYSPGKTAKIIREAGFKILWKKVLKLGGEKQFWILARNKK